MGTTGRRSTKEMAELFRGSHELACHRLDLSGPPVRADSELVADLDYMATDVYVIAQGNNNRPPMSRAFLTQVMARVGMQASRSETDRGFTG